MGSTIRRLVPRGRGVFRRRCRVEPRRPTISSSGGRSAPSDQAAWSRRRPVATAGASALGVQRQLREQRGAGRSRQGDWAAEPPQLHLVAQPRLEERERRPVGPGHGDLEPLDGEHTWARRSPLASWNMSTRDRLVAVVDGEAGQHPPLDQRQLVAQCALEDLHAGVGSTGADRPQDVGSVLDVGEDGQGGVDGQGGPTPRRRPTRRSHPALSARPARPLGRGAGRSAPAPPPPPAPPRRVRCGPGGAASEGRRWDRPGGRSPGSARPSRSAPGRRRPLARWWMTPRRSRWSAPARGSSGNLAARGRWWRPRGRHR